ncbi:transposase [Kutzneria buriramensis]|uniref:transposase n=1 Tax=Kutzneria buriramensis TaxID=1045776 RepID=UPI001B863DF7|nr:transposase [Kutzneria buriramensis]
MQLANKAPCEVRRRLTFQHRGRRGHKTDPEWIACNRLTRNWEDLRTGTTNAKSEGINRAVKLAARNAYGFRDPKNQRLRTRSVTSKVTVPGQV